MAIDKYTLLNIIEKFPTKESRNGLREILLDSSDEPRWRNEISHIFYILNKIDKLNESELSFEPVEIYNENEVIEELLPELTMEPMEQEPMEQEPIKELTEIEKIQLQYRIEMDKITKNKNDEILKYSV